MTLTSLNEIIALAVKQKTKRIAVAASENKHVLEAIKKASLQKIIEPILVGDESLSREIAESIGFDLSNIMLIHEPNPALAAKKAVQLVRDKKADILMKGMLPTALLLKAVLDKENGLRKRETLSHLAVFETSHYHKLLGVTDAAMNIAPELNEKINIIENAVEVFHSLGQESPKVAIISPLEVVNPKIPSTTDAAILTQMYKRKQIKSCIIDGPLAIDNAISMDAAQQKGIDSEVAGNADILVAPDLNSGNILYKTLIFLSDASSAAVILGAQNPIVLTSRADSEQSKLYSIALAAII